MDAASFVAELAGWIQKRGMTKTAVANAAGMHPSNLRSLFSLRRPNPQLETVFRIMNALDIQFAGTGASNPRELFQEFERRRVALGLSVTEIAKRAGIDDSTLCKTWRSSVPSPWISNS